MSIFAAVGIQYFEGEESWARGNAVWVKQNTEALAAQSAVVQKGIDSKGLTSWFGAFELQDNGDLKLIEAWHLDSSGTVHTGLPAESEEVAEPTEPTEPTAGDPAAWVPWDGNNENLYQVDDEVTHNGFVWKSIVSDNHWEPGVYGWEQLRPAL